jgi:5-methylthioadenosine/S-adenosylhomocysteine deaminase
MYFFPEAAAKAAFESGIRAQITFPVFDFPSAWGQGPDEYLSKGLALNDDYRSNELITIGFGPHAPYTVSDEPLQRIATIAEEMQAPIQIHLHETAFEVEESIKNTGKRPIQRLADLGLLSPLTQCVHMTQINEEDLELLKSTGAHIVHCPESNLKLASGFCPVDTLQQSGINVALGTDGAASNNDLDLLAELRTAALLAKGVSGNASALNAHQALRMATLNGAKAMGIDHLTGSLEAGKAADVIAIAFDELESLPLYNPASQLVYTQRSHRVTHSWVNGKCLMRDRQLQTLSEHEIITKAQRWQKKIAGQSH